MLFSELNLKSTSLEAISLMGFEKPSEIQEKSIPILLEKEIDFIGQAQTGTGKTAAFGLPLLEKIDMASKYIQAVIIAPTRELANQICVEIDKLSKFAPVRTLAVYGGVPISGQLRELKKNKPQVIVGTPGRLLDVMKRGAFDLEKCRYVILDEADEMLDMGFFDDVQEIIAEVPEKRIWMFSATMPKPILGLINKHFCNPELVKVTKQILTSDSVNQQFCVVRTKDQTEALCRYLDFNQEVYAIVFTRTKIGAKELTDELNMRGYPSDALHGDMSQEQRDITMKKFKQKKINLLVCTDVAARGIDVTDLTHVINFSLPQDNESYVHRIGRTGRGGSKGIALSIIEPTELRRISQIERLTKAKIEKIQLPETTEIVKILIDKAVKSFADQVAETSFTGEQFENFNAQFEEKSKEELIKALYSFTYTQSLKRYRNANSLEYTGKMSGSNKREEGTNGAQKGYERFHFNIGSEKGINTAELIRLVSRKLDIKGSEIGKISIMKDFSFFEVPDFYKSKILTLGGQDWRGEGIQIQVAKASRSGGGGRSRGGYGSRPRRGGSGPSRSREYSTSGSSSRRNRSEKPGQPKREFSGAGSSEGKQKIFKRKS